MALTPEERLRNLLGESVPSGGSAADTMFTDEQISDLLTEANDDLDRAAYEGWRIKAANYAGLVDVTDGNASRAMSDLLGHATEMVKQYFHSSAGPTEGRSRIGRIVRR